MKKLIAVATLLALGAVASAQSASSVNAAGFVKKTVARGTFTLLAVPFESFDGQTKTVSEIFGSSVPPESRVFIWNPASQTYSNIEILEPATIFNPGGWTPNNNQISRGQAVFLEIPASAPNPTYDVFLFGEVPDSRSAPTSTQSLVPGFQAIGFAYPIEISVTDADLGLVPTAGDRIFYWTPTGWQLIEFEAATIFNPGGWTNPNFMFKPGEGYFYQSVNAKDWVSTKDNFYTWP